MPKQLLPLICLLAFSCNKPAPPPLFEVLRKDATGLDFDNTPQQNEQVNVFNYMYFFNGGGLAAGDFNRDGRVDLFFTANMGPDKLFLNEGKLHFRDVSAAAAINPPDPGICWKTGASVVDINQDGLLDIYVSQVGEYRAIKGRNRLLVCQKIENGVPVFKDEAAAYGLDLVGFGTQAAFFDYDADGDLDMYQLNHSLHQNGTFGPKSQYEGVAHPLAGDRFFENRDGKYTDITKSAGIQSTVIGYGLGIALGDVNNDGWTDIYIGNDFHENDYLYINLGGNKGFKESITEYMQHTSRFSMGVDVADINNDGWQDIFSLDMEPEDPQILKASLGEDGFATYQFKLGYGYHNQYARNALQLNSGQGYFQEIAQFAGVSATDWSWSPLFADFDADGHKDLFISNGIPRRMNDVDYMRFQENREAANAPKNQLDIVEQMPRIKLPNKFFKNRGDLHFEDLEKRVAPITPSFSNGAVAVDLDNDGDLDFVTNNIEDEPFIYKNLDREQGNQKTYWSLELEGAPANKQAIGARVILYRKGGEQQVEQYFPVRGFQSSAQTPLYIGVGQSDLIDSVLLLWPDRTYQRIENPSWNSTQRVSWKPGLPRFNYNRASAAPAFTDITAQCGLTWTHRENPFIEFNREPLIPNMVSTEGPAVAVGDINGDGLDDVFFGSSKFNTSMLYIQGKDGRFAPLACAALARDSVFEDVDAVFADIENDGDLDLIVAAGGNEWRTKDEAMKQRYYLNDGKGNFSERRDFPGAFATASCVLPLDFNADGLVDFFIGGRAVPWAYGLTPNSYLFENKGNGQFEDVTRSKAKGLDQAGLVKNGACADLDADGDQDLLLALEWGTVTAWINDNKGQSFHSVAIGPQSGWWNMVYPFDADGDGDMDIIAGNTGENGRFHPDEQHPVKLYSGDFDQNGQVDQALTYFLKGREIPFATFEELTKTLPVLKKKYLYARDLAKADIAQIFGKENLNKAVQRSVNTLSSLYYEQTGPMQFTAHRLPDALQFSQVKACAQTSERSALMLGGNFYECNIEMGRYDANMGSLLRMGKNGAMEASGFGKLKIEGQVRRIAAIRIQGKQSWIWVRNNGMCLVLSSNDASLKEY